MCLFVFIFATLRRHACAVHTHVILLWCTLCTTEECNYTLRSIRQYSICSEGLYPGSSVRIGFRLCFAESFSFPGVHTEQMRRKNKRCKVEQKWDWIRIHTVVRQKCVAVFLERIPSPMPFLTPGSCFRTKSMTTNAR